MSGSGSFYPSHCVCGSSTSSSSSECCSRHANLVVTECCNERECGKRRRGGEEVGSSSACDSCRLPTKLSGSTDMKNNKCEDTSNNNNNNNTPRKPVLKFSVSAILGGDDHKSDKNGPESNPVFNASKDKLNKINLIPKDHTKPQPNSFHVLSTGSVLAFSLHFVCLFYSFFFPDQMFPKVHFLVFYIHTYCRLIWARRIYST